MTSSLLQRLVRLAESRQTRRPVNRFTYTVQAKNWRDDTRLYIANVRMNIHGLREALMSIAEVNNVRFGFHHNEILVFAASGDVDWGLIDSDVVFAISQINGWEDIEFAPAA